MKKITIFILTLLTLTTSVFAQNNQSYKSYWVRDYTDYKIRTKTYSKDAQKLAFLTFDDGPNNVITPQVLDILKKNNIKATFFVVGNNINDNTAKTLKRAYNEGHQIAIHSYTHDYKLLYPNRKGNTDIIVKEVLDTEKKIQKYLGPNYKATVWRYPGGHMSWKNLYDADIKLAKHGIYWIDWNAMTGDAEPKKNRPTTAEGTVNMLNKTINANKSSGCVVILMHDALGKKLTVKSLQSVIDNLKNRGYAFATIN